ncbi:MAG: tetratricopeptide repeat protein [Blastocatellales bacterium]
MFQALLLTLILIFAPQQAPDAAAKFNRAVELQQQGKLDEAAAEYRAALALKPDYPEAQANLGVVLARLGKYDEAIAAYEAALKLAPHLTPILLNLGIAHYRAGQFVKAIEVFERFLQQRPDSLQARQLYGLSLATLGRHEEAIRQLEPTLDAAPPDAAVLYNLGMAYLRLGKAGFRATLERLASFPAGLPALHLLQGQAFLRDQEYEQSLEELNAAAKLNSDLPRLHYSLGLTHLKLGRNKEALAAFEEERKRQPGDYSTLYYVAYLQEAEGQPDAAKRTLDEALKLQPESIEANALLSKILSKQGKAGEALAPLKRAVAKDPADPIKRYQLGRLYRQLGRAADANREFAEAQRLKDEQLKKDRANTPKPQPN